MISENSALTLPTSGIRRRVSSAVLAPALTVAGLIHLALTPDHLSLSVLLGTGFMAAGVAQLFLAALAAIRPSRLLYVTVIATSLVLTGLYAFSVVVGLPFHGASAAPASVEVHVDDLGAHGHQPERTDPEISRARQSEHDAHPVEADHHERGLVVGAGESVDAAAVVTQLAQFFAGTAALVLLVGPGNRGRRVPAA